MELVGGNYHSGWEPLEHNRCHGRIGLRGRQRLLERDAAVLPRYVQRQYCNDREPDSASNQRTYRRARLFEWQTTRSFLRSAYGRNLRDGNRIRQCGFGLTSRPGTKQLGYVAVQVLQHPGESNAAVPLGI